MTDVALDLVKFGADRLAKLYRRSRWQGVLASLLLVAAVVGFFFLGYAIEGRRLEASRTSGVQDQLKELDDIARSVEALDRFVESQQQAVRDQQEALELLQSERETLEPIVRSNREIVEALFAAQERRQSGKRWFDLAIGLVTGVLGSIVASIILGFARRVKPSAQSQEPQNLPLQADKER